MLSNKLNDALNDQMRFEIYSALTYKSMAGYCESLGLAGFSNFFQVQAQEELFHGDKFFKYICEAGGRARLLAIDAPRNDYESPLDAFEHGLRHEREVTKRINHLSDLALAESDHASRIFLNWFVTEQVEEEATFSSVVGRLKLVEGDGRGLLMLDQELAQRIFTPPTPAA